MTATATPMSLATFYAERFYFCIPSALVLELAPCPAITPVPLAPPAVSGLINLRGQIVTAIDLRQRLGLAPRAIQDGAMAVYLTLRGAVFALVVDRIGDIVELDPAQFDAPPAHLPAAAAELIVGFHALAEPLLLVLDADKLVFASHR